MANITKNDVETIARYRTEIADAMRYAVAMHADSIMREIAAFDAQRETNPVRWAQLTSIKSILSPGAKLPANIALARMLTDTMRNGDILRTYDDAETYRSACKYGGRSVGKNIVNALIAWNVLRDVTPDAMTWDTLATWNNGAALTGHALKTRSWTLALYDARNRVYTLDVHMVRGLCKIAGIERDNITDAAYTMLAELMLDIHDETCPEYPPLVSQWAMWNEFRHAGKHAEHIALAA